MSVSPGPLRFPQVHGGLRSNDRQPLRTGREVVLFQAERGDWITLLVAGKGHCSPTSVCPSVRRAQSAVLKQDVSCPARQREAGMGRGPPLLPSEMVRLQK